VTDPTSNKVTTTSTQPSNIGNGSPVTEIEKLKQFEIQSIQRVEEAKKKAKLEIEKTEYMIKQMRSQELANLKKKLSELEAQAENKAKVEAENIKNQGIKDAEDIKNKVSPRISKAVDYIVQRIVGGN
jgi:vacuolar-type H+-ATPase subunit H